MKAIKILLILLILSNIIRAQNITADTTLAKQYFETAKEYYKNKSYDTAIVNFEKASVLYEKNKLWKKYLLSETKHGKCYQKKRELDKAITILKPAIEKSLQYINKNDTIVADSYYILGKNYYYKEDYEKTNLSWNKTLDIYFNYIPIF